VTEPEKLNWVDFRAQELGGGLWATLVYRRVAQRFAYLFYRCGLGPNGVTLVSTITTWMAMIWLITGAPISVLSAIGIFTLMALGYAFDCADGQLARATSTGSKLGEWLDHTSDCMSIFVVHFCCGWVLLRDFEYGEHSHLIAFSAMALNLGGNGIYFFAWNMKTKIAGNNAVAKTMQKKSRKLALMKLPLQVTDWGLFIFVFLFTYNTQSFGWIYLGYGLLTAMIFIPYLLFSARALSKVN